MPVRAKGIIGLREPPLSLRLSVIFPFRRVYVQMTEHYMCNRTFTDTNSKMVPPGVSVNITKMLQYEQKMDSQFFLSQDPTTFDWRTMLRQVVPPTVWTARLERKVRTEFCVLCVFSVHPAAFSSPKLLSPPPHRNVHARGLVVYTRRSEHCRISLFLPPWVSCHHASRYPRTRPTGRWFTDPSFEGESSADTAR